MPAHLPVLDVPPPAAGETVAAEAAAAAAEREGRLEGWLRANAPVLVGYSGGVDSAYLAVVARRTLGRDGMLAVLGRSASVPAEQWDVAQSVADAHDVPVLVMPTDELDDPAYAANPVDRCYHCKKVLWRHLVPAAVARGFRTVVDGTNADDLHDHRPGARAAEERGVASPLAELGFTKAEIRVRSRALGLSTWDRPAAPCLASRLPYGTAVTAERLGLVERAESALRRLGVPGALRVRHHGEWARLELSAAADGWLEPARWPQLVEAVQGAGYPGVALDLSGFRSGSLNVLGGVHPAARAGSPGQSSPDAAHASPSVTDGAAHAWAAAQPAPVALGRLRVWQLDAEARDAALTTPAWRRALVARAEADGATHAALALTSA